MFLQAHKMLRKLFPTIYPDRFNDGFIYGGVAIELADCDGEKTAVFHTAKVSEPGALWLIQPAIQDTFQNFKPKLISAPLKVKFGMYWPHPHHSSTRKK